jgi:hypothetical protein
VKFTRPRPTTSTPRPCWTRFIRSRLNAADESASSCAWPAEHDGFRPTVDERSDARCGPVDLASDHRGGRVGRKDDPDMQDRGVGQTFLRKRAGWRPGRDSLVWASVTPALPVGGRCPGPPWQLRWAISGRRVQERQEVPDAEPVPVPGQGTDTDFVCVGGPASRPDVMLEHRAVQPAHTTDVCPPRTDALRLEVHSGRAGMGIRAPSAPRAPPSSRAGRRPCTRPAAPPT